jgi:hypothetical protein
MSYFDVRSEFFRPLWRRIVATAICLGWAVVEYLNGATGWALLFAVAGLALGWQFFLAFNLPEEKESDEK